MKNCFTVDLEDWYQGNECVKLDSFSNYESRIDYSTNILLDLLDEYKIKATFFILGYVAEKNPNLIKRVAQKGHEIASHGYSHELVYLQTPEVFRDELKKSKSLCEDISGQRVIGHRASNWTITKKSLWALDILKEEGFLYDSSIYPCETYLFGIEGSPRGIHTLENGLIEFPPSTTNMFGKTLGFAGGFFLRAWPKFFIKRHMESIHSEDLNGMLYLHPWELDKEQPKNLPIPLKNKIIHYYNISSTEKKLRFLFANYTFDRVDKVLGL